MDLDNFQICCPVKAHRGAPGGNINRYWLELEIVEIEEEKTHIQEKELVVSELILDYKSSWFRHFSCPKGPGRTINGIHGSGERKSLNISKTRALRGQFVTTLRFSGSVSKNRNLYVYLFCSP